MGEPKRAAATTEHPSLLAISRSSIVAWTAEELAAVEEAQREDGALIPQAAFERRLREGTDATRLTTPDERFVDAPSRSAISMPSDTGVERLASREPFSPPPSDRLTALAR